MQNLATETIIAGILKWLPLGHCVEEAPLANDPDLFMISWRPISSDFVITEVRIDSALIEMVQLAIESEDENLLERYSESIEDFIVSKAESFHDCDKHIWNLTAAILEE